MTCRDTSAIAAARVTLPSDFCSTERKYSTSKRLMASRRAAFSVRTSTLDGGASEGELEELEGDGSKWTGLDSVSSRMVVMLLREPRQSKNAANVRRARYLEMMQMTANRAEESRA
jgi:hypothetical protein